MAKILAIDLGKFKSVACSFNDSTGEYSIRSLKTKPWIIEGLFSTESPDRVVIEIGTQAGWIADLAEALGIEIQVANPNSEPRRWKNLSRKTDRDDALRLAQMSAMGNLPTVYMPKKKVRQWRSLIAYRHKLVSRRTAIKNSIRCILDQQGISWPSGRAGWTKQTLQNLEKYLVDIEKESTELWRVQISLEYESLLRNDWLRLSRRNLTYSLKLTNEYVD